MRALPIVCAVVALATSAVARAEIIYGVTDAPIGQALFMFDSANTSGSTTIATITGLGIGEVVRGIDFRPADELLYAITTTAEAATKARLYTIHLGTAAATAIGSGFTLTDNTSNHISLDFNPVSDHLRVVTGGGQNYRVNPIDGTLLAQDASLLDGAHTPLISGIGYSHNFVGSTQTTLYAYDYAADTLGMVGSLNGMSSSPNSGLYTVVGGSGVVTFSAVAGLDVSGATGIAYFGADDNDSPTAATELYTVNLNTGALTWVGNLPVAAIDISVVPGVPEPATWGLMLAGLGAIGRIAIRRRAG